MLKNQKNFLREEKKNLAKCRALQNNMNGSNYPIKRQ